MNNRLVGSFLVGLATLAGVAPAQVTRMAFETSLDGVAWAGGVRSVSAGSTVQFRCVVTFDPAGTTVSPVGFASLTFQPTVSNWTPADTLLPFATIGNNGSGGGVTESSGLYGRIIPFAATGPTSSDPYRGHLQANASVNYLRIARTTITNWIGVGPTSGTAAANNFNGAGGLACVQKGFGSVGPSDPPFNNSISGVVLSKFAVTLSSDTSVRQLQITVPLEGMSRNATTGAREAAWYASNTDLLGSVKTGVVVEPAVVEICQPPVAAVQPLPVLAHAGANATFSFSATGPGAISYRWRRNGSPLTDDARTFGTGTSQLTITGLAPGDVASYDCVASSACSSVTSNAATLALTPCPPAWLAGGEGGFGARWVHAQAYSGINSGTLLYGGRNASNSVTSDTWLRVGSSWTQVATTGPGPRNDHSMAPSLGGKVLLFGGQSGVPGSPSTFLSDTWEWNGTAWVQVATTGPSARLGAGMAFDSVSNRVVMFGGMAADGSLLDDLWEWDGTAWTQVVTAVKPPIRFAAPLAFDPVRRRTVLFGGYQFAAGFLRDTWEWDGTSWTQVASTGPSARYYHSLAYDPKQGGVVVYGGSINTAIRSDSSVWNGVSWVPCSATGSTTPRWALAGSYDPDAGRMIYTGGGGNGGNTTPYAQILSIADALFVAAQPTASVSPCEGSSAAGLLSFAVLSPSSITYQWRKGGVDIAGATSAQLSFNPVSVANAGTYTCVATSACGSVESSVSTVVVQTRPVFSQQPSSVSACAGQSVSLTAPATGSGPITYQWSKGGTPIDGATSATFSIGTLTVSNGGTYTCVATGPCGSVTSAAADITVQVAPFVATQPASATVCQTQPVSFTVVPGGTGPFTYVWKRNGTVVSGATSATLSIAATTPANAGSYVCEITGACGNVASNAATLTVNVGPSIGTQPSSLSVCSGAAASLTVAATGSGPLTFQWRKGGTNIPGATSATFSLAAAVSTDQGAYDCVVSNGCGSVTSSSATLTVSTAPSITTQPANTAACVGSGASFTVAATGTGPLTYQWRRGGVNISGATSATYSIASVASGNAGSYDCVVTNACGSTTTAAATLTVNTAPSVSTQPSNTSACLGSSASFTVAAGGTGPLTFQWRKGGTNIPGATLATFSVAAVTAGDQGSYDCVVTNGCGSVTSSAATLAVNVAPSVTTQPSNATACVGSGASFTVVAGGTAPVTFQWRKDGANIPGATSATYSVTTVAAISAGSYDCVVTNACGTVTSAAGILTVTTAPSVTTQPANAAACLGSSTSFSVAAAGTGPITYQWRLGGVNIAGATAATYSIAAVATANAGSYDCVVTNGCGSTTSSAATLTVNAAPTITTQPSNVTICDGATATWTVTVAGTAPLTYQWRKNGVNIPGATAASFSIASATGADQGAYVCVVTNACGNATTSGATLTVNVPPAWTSQPVSLSASVGETASLNGVASGAGPISYQWRKNGVNIPGATSSTLTFQPVDASDAGSYACVATNTCGSTSSSSADLFITQTGITAGGRCVPVHLIDTAGLAGDRFGSVSMSGDTVVVGADLREVGSNADQGYAIVFRRTSGGYVREATLVDPSGVAGDNFGNATAVIGNTAVVGAWLATVDGRAAQGAVYVYVRVGSSWVQQAKLVASDGAAGDSFGVSLAFDGDTIAVGSYRDDIGAASDQGSVYVFTRSGNTWSQQAKLVASDGAAADTFGNAVHLRGDDLIVGSPKDATAAGALAGSAYVFTRSGSSWTQQAKLVAADARAGDFYGIGVAIEGNDAIVGAFAADVGANANQGAAYVYRRSGTSWSQEAKLVAPGGAAGDSMGLAVTLRNGTAAVSAFLDDVGTATDAGTVHLFARVGSAWQHQARLEVPGGGAGGNDQFGFPIALSDDAIIVGASLDDVNGRVDAGSAWIFSKVAGAWLVGDAHVPVSGAAGDAIGSSIAVHGDTMAVGAPGDTIGAASSQGSVSVLVRSGGQWVQQATLVAVDGAAGDRFGASVAVEGDTIVVGASGDDLTAPGGVDSGSAYVFVRSGTSWTQQVKLAASDATVGARFGQAVSISGDSLAVGASAANAAEGAAYVYVRSGSTWTQQARVLAADRAAGDAFGASLAIRGDELVVGAPQDDNIAGIDQGSVYVMARAGGVWSQVSRLSASDAAAGDAFGSSVAITESSVVVGSPSDDVDASVNQGSVHVFARSGSGWLHQARLLAGDGSAGDSLGSSVAAVGDMIVAGAPSDDIGASVDAGSSVVFTRTGSSWTRQFRLVPPVVLSSSQVGCAVSVAGSTVAVGGRGFASSGQTDQGAAWTFEVPSDCIPGVLNLASGTFSQTLAAAIASTQSGQRLQVAPATFPQASLVDTLGRSLSIESTGGVRTVSGSIVTLGGASSLLADLGEGIEIGGQLFAATGSTAHLAADRLHVGGKGGITARVNSSLNVNVDYAELNGTVRAESGSSLAVGATMTEIGGSVRVDASASLAFAGDAVSAGSIAAAADSTVAATGLLDLQGTTSITNGLLAASTILNRDRLELSGSVSLQGGTINLRDLDAFGSSAIFGDFTNGVGAVTTIRSGTLFLFGSLSNSGSIIGTICSNCLGGPPSLEVSGDLQLGSQASLLLPFAGSQVSVGGDFDAAIDSNDRFDLSLAMLRLEGLGAEQTLEAMSADIGPSEGGLDRLQPGHFPIGTLKIGPTPSIVRVVDVRDNDAAGQESCEAIYVDTIEISAGSRLINDGCAKIYYRTLVLDGTVDVPDSLVPYSSACVADFNQDGGVDGGDIDAFFAAWEAAEPNTDLNQDGGIDGGDIVYFFDRWEAGC